MASLHLQRSSHHFYQTDIGDAAKNQASSNPTNTVFGRFFVSVVQNDMKLWPFKVIGVNDKPTIIVKYKGEEKRFCAEEISSMILSKMREVCFDINENGILIISASEKSTGNRTEIPITNDKERLSSQQIKEMTRDAENYRIEAEKFLRKANLMNGLDYCIYKMKNALKNKDIKLKLSSQRK
ncbi:putative Heat shock protein 70 family [Medicago truncatula]|uniref:Putative Heat shock protein 70 family n=1 Tax=Medicago truncatula TaxID=3880 RepID=A0A396GWG3_MEDTR|nr:putative Heat shock protein 70 family [Medicago truncatula]